jgi:hypothetical protein
MSDIDVATQAPAARWNASKVDPKHRISGKARAAIDAMVWQGLPRDKAAVFAGISDHGLYKALRSPPVKAYYLAELEVLRTSERARNYHRLVEIRDAANNMPAVQAIDRLMQAPDAAHGGESGVSASPGITIRIINQAAAPPMIDVTPERNDA